MHTILRITCLLYSAFCFCSFWSASHFPRVDFFKTQASGRQKTTRLHTICLFGGIEHPTRHLIIWSNDKGREKIAHATGSTWGSGPLLPSTGKEYCLVYGSFCSLQHGFFKKLSYVLYQFRATWTCYDFAKCCVGTTEGVGAPAMVHEVGIQIPTMLLGQGNQIRAPGVGIADGVIGPAPWVALD